MCHVCADFTEKDLILCEGIDPSTGDVIRVCSRCLREGKIDERLEQTARDFEREIGRPAIWRRSLIGRIIAPTYEQWEEQMKAAAKE
jgi:hypothetical protein